MTVGASLVLLQNVGFDFLGQVKLVLRLRLVFQDTQLAEQLPLIFVESHLVTHSLILLIVESESREHN